jgi:serine/threonine protein kinase
MNGLSDAALRRLRDAADAPDLTGTKYEIIDRIGQGGMGTVYRARDRELDRDVALKVVRLPEGAPDIASRLTREARTLARLEHPGIVYAMKLVRGAPLDQLPATGLAERLRIVERVCEAVAFAHAHGVIHRDLKPQNVMVGPFGEVLVMDWGVAKIVGGATSLGIDTVPDAGHHAAPSTGHGVVLGTPGYMAPEQAAGDPSLVDARADVYAIGAILRDLCAANVEASRPDASGGVPQPLRAIIRRAMAPAPSDRYEDVTALARDVAAFRADDRVSAYAENLFERARRLAVRHRTPILLVLAYLLMRVTFLAVFGR